MAAPFVQNQRNKMLSLGDIPGNVKTRHGSVLAFVVCSRMSADGRGSMRVFFVLRQNASRFFPDAASV